MIDSEIPEEQMRRIGPMLESLRHQLAELKEQLPPAPGCAISFHPLESE